MRGLGLVVLISCGGSQPTRAEEWQAPVVARSGNVDAWTRPDEDTHIRRSCANVVDADGRFRCDALGRAGLVAGRCVESLHAFRAAANSEAHVLAFRTVVHGLSVARSCADVDASFQAGAITLKVMHAGRHAGIKTSVHIDTCTRRSDGSYDLSDQAMRERRGLGDRRFGETPSSKDAPIEVCGVDAELAWLVRMTCADGSRPFGRDHDKAHAARRGSISGHARCDRLALMLDHYEVPCPEQRYDVYMDMYQCGPGESLRRGMKP